MSGGGQLAAYRGRPRQIIRENEDAVVILTPQGQEVTLDRDFYEANQGIKPYTSNTGRVCVSLNGSSVPLASLVLTSKAECIDHLNGDAGDNRRANLRSCSKRQNARNREINAHNSSGFKGVTPRVGGKYSAQIHINRKQKYLGTFSTAEDAARAYDAAARQLFGEFACLNFPGSGEQSAHRERSYK